MLIALRPAQTPWSRDPETLFRLKIEKTNMPTRIQKDVFFWQSLVLPRTDPCRCQRREMTISTINGPVNGPVHNLLVQFFSLYSSKIEVFERYFFDIVNT